MTAPRRPEFKSFDAQEIKDLEGRIAIIVGHDARLDEAARVVDQLSNGAVGRMIAAETLKDKKNGDILTLTWPSGMAASAVDVVIADGNASPVDMRKAGAKLAAQAIGKDLHVMAEHLRHAENFALGIMLRDYDFTEHKSKSEDEVRDLTVHLVNGADKLSGGRISAVANGVFTTRDLVNEPANYLTTTEFARRIAALSDLGLIVTILDEDELEELGMGALLSVGQGSESPSKVAIMEWRGGEANAAPLALVGKGVVFDTGGISLKPAAGMEDMTMDMGGAGVVTGVMQTLALRNAPANVVGLVGLVENMPSGRATRPGDVVTSMKGDTIEVINTDAEGRLVLADVLWYAQKKFKPAAIVDLATLTGAIIIGLGHTNAGIFSNDTTFCDKFLKSALNEGEGAWRMPMDDAYDELLKSRIADVKNVGGRAAGSVTAAKFLQRFINEDVPWIHLDIAGVASVSSPTDYAPKGATGWGVMALDRLVADHFESSES